MYKHLLLAGCLTASLTSVASKEDAQSATEQKETAICPQPKDIDAFFAHMRELENRFFSQAFDQTETSSGDAIASLSIEDVEKESAVYLRVANIDTASFDATRTDDSLTIKIADKATIDLAASGNLLAVSYEEGSETNNDDCYSSSVSQESFQRILNGTVALSKASIAYDKAKKTLVIQVPYAKKDAGEKVPVTIR